MDMAAMAASGTSNQDEHGGPALADRGSSCVNETRKRAPRRREAANEFSLALTQINVPGPLCRHTWNRGVVT
jgi:hypothetical protein